VYKRVEYRLSALRGKKPLPADCFLYTQKVNGSASLWGRSQPSTVLYLPFVVPASGTRG